MLSAQSPPSRSSWLGATIAREFLPELDEGSITIHVSMPPGISLADGDRHGRRPAQGRAGISRGAPTSSRELGRNDEGTDPWTPSHIEADIGLRPHNTWPSGGTTQI